jgi:signal transduction histidine kinase
MKNIGPSVELDLNLLAEVAPLTILVGADLATVWASHAVVRLVPTVVGTNVARLVRPLDPPGELSLGWLAGKVGQLQRFAFGSGETRVPLIGRWFSCQDRYLLLATPNPASSEELSLFSINEFPPESHLVEMLVGRDETRVSLQEAASAAAALKRRNKDLDESKRRIESVNVALESEIAERQNVESALAAINEELNQFAYTVSHDLKAPLRGIRLIAEWLLADLGDGLGEEAKEQLGLLQSRVMRMQNLIDGVLQYSRVGRIKEEKVEVDLAQLMPVIVDMITPPEHIRIMVEEGLPVIEGEKTRIMQVFQNLLSNAVKYMDKPRGEVRVGCVEDGDFWRFSVRDNGPGIEEQHYDRIFRLFQVLAPRDEVESTGIGLTVAKKIVEMYGGRIWVESEVGRGSTFLFTFPRNRGAVVSEGPTPAAMCQSAS